MNSHAILFLLFIVAAMTVISLNCQRPSHELTPLSDGIVEEPAPPPVISDTIKLSYGDLARNDDSTEDILPGTVMDTISVLYEDLTALMKETGMIKIRQRTPSYSEVRVDQEQPSGECDGSKVCAFVCRSFKKYEYVEVCGIPLSCTCSAQSITCRNGCPTFSNVCAAAARVK